MAVAIRYDRGNDMNRVTALWLAGGTSASILTAWPLTTGNANEGGASPIYGVRIPAGYRQWHLIAPAQQAEPPDELRAALGNAVQGSDVSVSGRRRSRQARLETCAVSRIRAGLHSRRGSRSPDHGQGFEEVSGDRRLGVGRFVNGKPVDEAQHETCFAPHEARVKGHDTVFTRYAP